MDFSAQQAHVRGRRRRLVTLFVLAVITIVNVDEAALRRVICASLHGPLPLAA